MPASSAPSADLERAVPGIVRSAFGLSGQKCSALSRMYVVEGVADRLIARLIEASPRVARRRSDTSRPVDAARCSTASRRSYVRHVAELGRHGGAILMAGGDSPTARSANGFVRRADHRRRTARPPALRDRDVPADRDDRAGGALPRRRSRARMRRPSVSPRAATATPPTSSTSSSTSRPAPCTSTGRRVRPPARGPAVRRSAAGRAPARPTRRSAPLLLAAVPARAVANRGRVAAGRSSTRRRVSRRDRGRREVRRPRSSHSNRPGPRARAQPDPVGRGAVNHRDDGAAHDRHAQQRRTLGVSSPRS